jgi:amino acid transporter
MSVKFIPIIFAFIIGYIYLGTGNAIANPLLPEPPTGPSANTPLFSQLSPAFGVIASIPAIFFAFNGFTFPANLTSDMKEPKKLPLTMTLGLIIVTIIYVGISVSILIASPGGKVEGLQG